MGPAVKYADDCCQTATPDNMKPAAKLTRSMPQGPCEVCCQFGSGVASAEFFKFLISIFSSILSKTLELDEAHYVQSCCCKALQSYTT